MYRAQFTNILTNFLHKEDKNLHFLRPLFKKCRKFFKEHPEILDLYTDKGNVIVIMYKKDYVEKRQLLFNDETYYIPFGTDQTSTLEEKA